MTLCRHSAILLNFFTEFDYKILKEIYRTKRWNFSSSAVDGKKD